ncbi:MAG: cytochrome P450 [Bacteroidetes bacterium]|nr:cytochrome P450 [Bacteroidota bacterium]MDE2673070.1 cytochrome P450 [Bacteroidota bacterium]
MSENVTLSEISFAEELILLMLDEKTGYLEVVPDWQFSCVLAGALISELAHKGRIDTDLESLYLVDSTPTGDELLDVTLRDIEKSEKVQDIQYWIERNAQRVDDIITTSFDRLVERHILVHELGGFFGLRRSVSRSGTYPSSDSSVRREAKTRILHIILHNDIPDPRDAILIALVHTLGGFKLLLEEEDYEEVLDRIKLVSRLDVVGRKVAAAVDSSTFQPRRAAIRTKPIPKVRISDVLGRRDFIDGHVAKGLYRIYNQYGPVAKMPAKVQGVRLFAVMGAEANQWINRNARFYLRSKEYIVDFEHAFGSTRTLPGSDGANHYRMRKAVKGSYSRSALANKLSDLYHHSRISMSKWKEGDAFPMIDVIRAYMADQIGPLVISTDCTNFSKQLLDYEHRALVVHVTKVLPRFMMRTPKMKRYGKLVKELSENVILSHTPGQRKGQPIDIADAFLELHRNDPQFMSETDLTFPMAAGMVAAIYVGGGISFALYCMIRNPEVYEGVYKEAEKLFGNGRMPKEEDFNLSNTDVTHRLILESTRMYPVIPWQLRAVVNRFVIEGYEIPPGTRLVMCHTATHYNEKLFKDPYKFDIDRYLPERAEHKQPGAYMPYGLGTHTCLGRRYTDLLMVANILLIAYHFKLDLLPKERELKINPFPSCAPRKNVKLVIRGIRNPIPSA